VSSTATGHAYRSPTVLFGPSLLFRAGKGLTLAILVIVALVGAVQVWANVVIDYCARTSFGVACAGIPMPGWTLLDDPDEWQKWILARFCVRLPAVIPVLVLALDVAAAFFFVQTRTARLDDASRTLHLRHRRWPRRPQVLAIRYEEVLLVAVQRRFFLHSVEVVDRDGRPFDVTGPCLGRSRPRRVAEALERALAREV
jgi:hypothetical protein